jgi:D-3-phosphoglycerate dehydrogenase
LDKELIAKLKEVYVNKWKVALTREGATEDDFICGYLKERNFDVYVRPLTVYDEDDCIRRLKGMDAVVATSDPYTAKVLNALKGTMKIISRTGIGLDTVDLKEASRLGIIVCNTPGLMANQVAEHALGLLLSMTRSISVCDARVKSGAWPKDIQPRPELEGKTVGLVGFGSIAKKFVQYLRGFECSFLAYDSYFDEEAAKKLGVSKSSIEEILSKSDVVSLHIPSLPETKGMVDKTFLSKMKKSAILLNTARGTLVNEDDLYEALKNGVIAGAALDVMQSEAPDSSNPLFGLDNVVITSHIGSVTTEGFRRVLTAAADRVCECRDGREILNKVSAP